VLASETLAISDPLGDLGVSAGTGVHLQRYEAVKVMGDRGAKWLKWI
jgi:hypothetical protein